MFKFDCMIRDLWTNGGREDQSIKQQSGIMVAANGRPPLPESCLEGFNLWNANINDRHLAIFRSEVGNVIDATHELAAARGVNLLPTFALAIKLGPNMTTAAIKPAVVFRL